MIRRAAMRFFRALYRCYPPAFHARYGAEMEWLLERLLAEQTTLGGRLRVLRVALVDWVRSLIRERRKAARHQPLRIDDRPKEANMLSTVMLDLRFAVRWLVRQPALTVAALATMALGIGTNTALFSVVHAVVLEPLPYEAPERIVRIWPGRTFSKEMFDRFRAEATSFTALTPISRWSLTLTGDGEPEELDGLVAGATYFELLGMRPRLGRAFAPEDAAPGAEAVAVISHDLWQGRFGGDPAILGRRIELSDGRTHERTVVGVLPETTGELDAGVAAWLPLVIDPANERDYGGSWYLRVYGRLTDGIEESAASAEVASIARRYQHTDFTHFTDDEVARAGVVVLIDELVGSVRGGLWLMLGGVGVVLLLACANVANLLLASTAGRSREIAIRAALGAGSSRLLRQLLTESMVLGLAGGVLGASAAWVSIRLLIARLPDSLPRREEVGIDLTVLGFSVAVSLAAGLLFGLAPALRVLGRRRRLMPGRTDAGPRRHRLSQAVVVAEVALAVVVVVAAGLLLKSFGRLTSVDPGFEPAGIAVARISAPSHRYQDPAAQQAFFRGVETRIAALPGVQAVGANHLLPMTDDNWSFPYEVADQPIPADTPPPTANYRVVRGDYFRTLGIPLLQGRVFGPSDQAEAEKVVVINQAMAHERWPNANALGREVRLFRSRELTFRVVGVVGNVRQHRLQLAPQPEMYYTHAQRPTGQMYVMARTDGDPATLLPALREAVWSIDRDVPVTRLAAMESVIRQSVARSRFFASLLGLFALLALVLGAVGVYGVMSYAVAERDREFGVRIALGASAGEIVRRAVRGGVGLVVLGVGLGLLGSLASSRTLSSLLFEVEPTDPAVFALVAAVLLTVALAACYLPARRASSVDPIEVLRNES